MEKGIILAASHYLIIFLMAIYTIKCFTVFRHNDKKKQNKIFIQQNILMFTIHFLAFLSLFIKNPEESLLLFYGAQFILILFILLMYNAVYPECSRLIINNMCMSLIIGFIFVTRINYKSSIRQFVFVVIGIIISTLIPFIIKKMKILRNLWVFYAIISVGGLLVMRLLSVKTLGAHVQVSLFGFSFQPQEFIKIVYVFMIASIFDKGNDIKRVLISGVLAMVQVLILVWGKDLGVALIFSFVYLIMLFVATRNKGYLALGVFSASGAFVAGYHIFSHVRQRITIWLNPWPNFLNEGYQIGLSLFAIANGSWFGLGLGNGRAYTIPIVMKDLIVIPIIEEMGLIFSLFLILICVSCFVMFLNISAILKDGFYKMVSIGLGTTYMIQTFLSIGGSTKFIPLTGVTVPLISYGGSSMLASIICFSIIQGLYVLRGDNSKMVARRKKYENKTSIR